MIFNYIGGNKYQCPNCGETREKDGDYPDGIEVDHQECVLRTLKKLGWDKINYPTDFKRNNPDLWK